MDSILEERLKKAEERLKKLEDLLQSKPIQSIPSKKMSEKEFLLSKQLTSITETCFYLGFYLEKIESKESFSVEDLKGAFRLSKTPLPKNMNDLINKNIFKGYFMEVDKNEKGQKTWMLTTTGEKHAEESRNG